MILDSSHRKWGLVTLGATLGLTATYFLSVWLLPHPHSGGSVLGLTYGTVALLIMIFASLLGVRKKVPAWRIGRATTWMKGHLWLSLWLIPLVLYHSAFRMGGALTVTLWALFTIVTLSGILGILLQQYLPRLMTEQAPMETIYDQIDHVINQIRYQADIQMTKLVGPLGIEMVVPEGMTPEKFKPESGKEGVPNAGTEQIKNFYLERIRPGLDPRKKFAEVFGTPHRIHTFFEEAKLTLPPSCHALLQELNGMLEERRQLERQRSLHHWLHGWLFVHVPLSVLLMLLVVVHVVTALWY